MARKSQQLFTANVVVSFRFKEGTSYSAVQRFLKDAKGDITALFEQRVEVEVGRVVLEKKITY